MTKEEFKQRWESNANGGGITFNDIADCSISWGLYKSPKASPINQVTYAVLRAAGTSDAEDYKP